MEMKLISTKKVTIDKGVIELVAEGWNVIKEPRKNWLGYWVCKLIKTSEG